MEYCKRYIKTAFKIDHPGQAVFTRLRCKQWSCDFCAKKNASQWRAYLSRRLPEVSDEWWLLTITAAEWTRSRQESIANIRNNIDVLFKRARRVFGSIEYVRVYERHPTSEAVHAHLVITGLSPYVAVGQSEKLRPMAIGVLTRKSRNGVWTVKTWFKITCRSLKMGYIVDVKPITGDLRRVGSYVLKYATKALQDIHEPYLRHIQVTSGIGGLPGEESKDWRVVSYITVDMFKPGTKITDLNTGQVIDNNYWELPGNTFYPRED